MTALNNAMKQYAAQIQTNLVNEIYGPSPAFERLVGLSGLGKGTIDARQTSYGMKVTFDELCPDDKIYVMPTVTERQARADAGLPDLADPSKIAVPPPDRPLLTLRMVRDQDRDGAEWEIVRVGHGWHWTVASRYVSRHEQQNAAGRGKPVSLIGTGGRVYEVVFVEGRWVVTDATVDV
jgi:hypothetical protein